METLSICSDGDTACSVDGFLANSSQVQGCMLENYLMMFGQACQDYVYDRGVFR